MLNHALRYLNLGFSVVPVPLGEKHPIIKWKEFQARLPTSLELHTWFSTPATLNLGVVTGTVSNLTVIDLDGPSAIQWAENQKLKSPVTVVRDQTHRHLWFQNVPGLKGSASQLAPGVDIRATGGLIVVPPSIHKSGAKYRFLGSPNLTKLPKLVLNMDVQKDLIAIPQILGTSKSPTWFAECLKGMTNGNIDTSLFTLVSRLRADGYSAADTLALLGPHATSRGATAGHLEAKIQNVYARYPEGYSNGRGLPPLLSTETSPKVFSSADSDDERFDEVYVDSATALRSGYSKLDSLLEGGLRSERIFTIAARTGTGKTNWLIGCAREICRQDKRVLFFSTEFRYQKIRSRYKATLADIGEYRRHQFMVCDSFTPNLNQVEQLIIETKPDVFIFDHANQISEETTKLSEFMHGLNFLQRKYNCQGILAAQLNRMADWVENGKRVEPRLSMIKGSDTIGQASSRVLLLSVEKSSPEKDDIIGILDKNDSGDKGMINFSLLKNPYKLVEA